METATELRSLLGESAGDQFITVAITDTGETYRCRTQESILESMRRLGKRGIPVGCRSGGCSVCKVQVIKGAYQQIRPMSREYIDNDDLAAGRVLACCVRPVGDITLQVIGKLRKSVVRNCAEKK